MDDWFSVTVGGTASPDLAAVDALGRLLLGARKAGAGVRIDFLSAEMTELLALVGLRVEVGGETEIVE